MNKKLKITFAPGCFDQFEGTQEELDELVSMIKEEFESGEIFDRAVSLDDLLESGEGDEVLEQIVAQLSTETPTRKLQ